MSGNPYQTQAGVFLNLLGISDKETLRSVEYAISLSRAIELINDDGDIDLPLGFGLERLCAIHYHLFKDIYAWAGIPRSVRSSKSMGINGLVSVFAEPQDIVRNWEKLKIITENFVLQNHMPFEERVKDLASIYAKANFNHAFVEGNTRSLQIFLRQLAKTQNIFLDFSKAPHQRKWLEACGVSGYHGEVVYGDDGGRYLEPLPPNIQPLTDIFFDIASEIANPPQRPLEGFELAWARVG